MDFINVNLKDLEKIYYDSLDIEYKVGLTTEQLKWLLDYMCVKDNNGYWHGLFYNEYQVIFDKDRIWIKLDSPLYDEKGKVIPFNEKYLVKSDLDFEQITVSENVIFPKYTGYEAVLNGKAQEIYL